MSLSLCFKGESHPLKIDEARVRAFAKDKQLKYYNYKIHNAAFCLPDRKSVV